MGGNQKFCLGWGGAEIFRIHRYVSFVYSGLGLDVCSFQMQLFVEECADKIAKSNETSDERH